ncbi:hypothetical protein GCM10020218_044140 [Dactylosporangium vinaceum]
MAAEVAFVDPITCLAAPAAWLPEGLFVDGVRILSRWDVLVDGAAPTPVSSHRAGASSAVFSAVAAGPELTVVRRRLAEPMGGTETITLSNAADVPMTVTVTVLAEALASARIETTPPCAGTPLTWTAEVPPRGSWQVEARITRTDIPPTARPKRFSTLRVTADDPRLDALVRAGVQDLDALRRTAGPDAYYSTSSPSHLTLSPTRGSVGRPPCTPAGPRRRGGHATPGSQRDHGRPGAAVHGHPGRGDPLGHAT